MAHTRVICASLAFTFTVLAGANIASANSNVDRGTRIDAGSSTSQPTSSNTLIALVDREARANGVPVALARAVVRIESNWNTRMTGRAGEVGLMQIKQQTARGVGYGGSRAALYEPATNIKFGMRYLAGAYRLAGGDTCGTVMRYQGGHGATRMSSAARTYCSKARTIMASN
jgi:soluble lytic murein transglycosylase-like protein